MAVFFMWAVIAGGQFGEGESSADENVRRSVYFSGASEG
jgi:hypothetical protein